MKQDFQNNEPLNILVTDGENRSALAVTRSLGKAGHRIVVTSKKRQSISGSSKYCSTHHTLCDPLKDPEKYTEEIIDVLNKESIDLIMPMTEATIYALNSVRNQLTSQCILASPDPEKFDSISNKFELFTKAKNLGISIPETIFVANKAELNAKIDRIRDYPVIVKPGRSKMKNGNTFISSSVMYAGSKDELRKLYDTTEALNYPSLIQEIIQGPGTGLFTLFDKESHLALFSHQRLREKPPSGGVSVVCESVPIDKEMALSATKLLSSVAWQGVAMVEFKRDLRDGTAKLMEINGRFWGSLQLAISAGVDFPRLLLEYIFGNSLAHKSYVYRKGLKLKWILGTLDHLIIRLKNNQSKIFLNGASSTRLNALTDFIKIYDQRTTFDVYSISDLKPFLAELKQYVKDLR